MLALQVAPWQLEIEVRCQASVTVAVARAAPWHRGTARASARGPLPAGLMLRVDFLLLDSRGSSVGRESPGRGALPSAAKCAKSELPPSGIGKYCNPRCSPPRAWYPTHFWDNQPLASLHEGFWIHCAIYSLKAAHNYRSRSSLSTLVARVTRETSMDGWGILTSREIDCSRCSTTFSHIR